MVFEKYTNPCYHFEAYFCLFCNISTFSTHWCHSSWKDAYLDHRQIQKYLSRKKAKESHLHYKIILLFFPIIPIIIISFTSMKKGNRTNIFWTFPQHQMLYYPPQSVISFTSSEQPCPLGNIVSISQIRKLILNRTK